MRDRESTITAGLVIATAIAAVGCFAIVWGVAWVANLIAPFVGW